MLADAVRDSCSFHWVLPRCGAGLWFDFFTPSPHHIPPKCHLHGPFMEQHFICHFNMTSVLDIEPRIFSSHLISLPTVRIHIRVWCTVNLLNPNFHDFPSLLNKPRGYTWLVITSIICNSDLSRVWNSLSYYLLVTGAWIALSII